MPDLACPRCKTTNERAIDAPSPIETRKLSRHLRGIQWMLDEPLLSLSQYICMECGKMFELPMEQQKPAE